MLSSFTSVFTYNPLHLIQQFWKYISRALTDAKAERKMQTGLGHAAQKAAIQLQLKFFVLQSIKVSMSTDAFIAYLAFE